jgi:tRNA(Ile)-lysidine synthase
MNKNLKQRVKEFIDTHSLCQQGETVVVGVSGGIDSVCLLMLLKEFQYSLGIQLHVAHFNHALRKSADSDERFVRTLCQHLHIPISAAQWKRKSSNKNTVSEDAARKARMQFLMQTAQNLGAKTIALAHTQNDLAETVLMRILRGSGLHGLRGILPKRALQGFTFVRPLLETARQDLVPYLKKMNVSYRQDPSNFQPIYLRNKVRLKLLPLIRKEYQSNIDHILTDIAQTVSLDYEYIENQAQKVFKKLIKRSTPMVVTMALKPLLKVHKSLRHMVCRLAVQQLKGNAFQLDYRHIQELDDLLQARRSQSVVNLPGALRAHITDDIFVLERTNIF